MIFFYYYYCVTVVYPSVSTARGQLSQSDHRPVEVCNRKGLIQCWSINKSKHSVNAKLGLICDRSHGKYDFCHSGSRSSTSLSKENDNAGVTEPSRHLRAAQEVVELDLSNGSVRLEVGELVSEQKSRHCRVFPAAFPTQGQRHAHTSA